MENKTPDQAKKEKNYLAELLSIFDNEIQGLAIKAANAIPQGNMIRGQLFARAFGPLKAWVEENSEDMNPFLGAIVEKLVDMGDAFSTAIKMSCETVVPTNNSAPKKQEKEKKEEKQDWVEEFRTYAHKRIHTARDKQAEAEKLKTEFKIRLAILKFVQAKTKIPPPVTNTTPEKTLFDELKNIKRAFWSGVIKIGTGIDDGLGAAVEHVSKIADWAERLPGGKPPRRISTQTPPPQEERHDEIYEIYP